MTDIRHLRGSHGDNRRFHFGPGTVIRGYPTTRNGWADNIQCDAGEVVPRTWGGSAESFAHWVAGPVSQVVAYLRGEGHRPDLAEEIETAVNLT